MKRRDLILAAAVVIIAAVMLLVTHLNDSGEPELVRITSDKEVYEYPFGEEQEIRLGGNVIQIEADGVYMKSADCPDKTCVHQGMLKDQSGQIVCLPNHMVIELVGGEETVDAVVY